MEETMAKCKMNKHGKITSYCESMDKYLGLHEHKFFIYQPFINMKTGKTTGTGIISYKSSVNDGGAVCKFCPFCGGVLYQDNTK